MPGPVVTPGRYAATSGTVTAGSGTLYALPKPWPRIRPSRIVTQPGILTSTVSDNFDAGAINTALWTQNYGTLRQLGGRAGVWSDGTTVDYSGFATSEQYQLDTLVCQAFPHPGTGTTTGDASTAFWFQNGDVDGTDVGFYYDTRAGNLWLASRTGYFDGGATIIPLDITAHRWGRLSLQGSLLVWETAPDGLTWTTRRSMTAPAWVLTERRGRIMMEGHQDDGTPSWAEFDNLNIIPSPPVNAPAESPGATGEALDATVIAITPIAKLNTFDAGSVGTNITTSNSATSGDPLTAVVVGGDGSVTYISGAYRGAAAARVASGASGAIAYIEQATDRTSVGQAFIRARIRMPVMPGDTTGIRMLLLADSTGAFQAEVRLASTGKVQLRSGAGISQGNSTATYVAGQWVDVALAVLEFSATVGVVECKLYDSTGAVAETITSPASLDTLRNGGATKVQAGMLRSTITNFVVDVDDLAYSNTAYPNTPVATSLTDAPAEAAMATGESSPATVAMDGQADVATSTGVANPADVATMANAGVATGVATGQDASLAIMVNADVATASGSAPPASGTVAGNADVATGVGTSGDATVSAVSATNADAQTAAAAGTALDGLPNLQALPAAAQAAGEAPSATVSLQAGPGTPEGAGTAPGAQVALLASAEVASGLGSAEDATVSTLTQTNAPAEAPAAAGTALDASASSSALPGAPVAAGSAADATASSSAQAAQAAGSGSALDAVAALELAAQTAVATGSAEDATVATATSVAAPAELAMATGSSLDATVASSVPAGVATGLGQADVATALLATNSGVATGAGSAADATVSTLTQTNADATVATGVGSALDASVAIGASADVALALGSALLAGGQLGAQAAATLGSGSAANAQAVLAAMAEVAEAAGEALDLVTGGGTSAPTGWLLSATPRARVLASVTGAPLISQTQRDEITSGGAEVLVTETVRG